MKNRCSLPDEPVWTIESVEDFPAWTAAWDALNASGANSLLLRAMFWAPLIRHFGAGREVLAVFGAPDSPRAMGIFQRRAHVVWQTFQPSVAPLGAWVMAPGQSVELLLEGLRAALPGAALMVSLSQIDPDHLCRPEDGRQISTMDYILTPRLTIDTDYDRFWSSRSKNLRHSLKRVANRLQREGRRHRLEILTEEAEMAGAVLDYARLESSGWKGSAGTAVLGGDNQGRFYIDMLKSFCRTGEAMVCRYWFGERLVASDICIYNKECLIILKTAYDEIERAYSPAQLMRHAAFRRFFDDYCFRAIEFYGPVKDWHAKLTREVRRMYHLNYYRWPILASLHRLRLGSPTD